jgi:hypothetical protein
MTTAALFSIALAIGMVLLLEVGRRLAARRLERDPEGARVGIGAVDGAVFALLGLLIAFTFSGAATRFDARRNLIIDEANAIATAYLRLDLLPTAAQSALREQLGRYLDARLAIYQKESDPAASEAAHAEANRLQTEIWNAAVAAAHAQGVSPAAPMLLLPALNDMFDVAARRTDMNRMHPPVAIYAMLYGLALASALFAGYGMGGAKSRSWLHMIGFALVMAVATYVILDLEYPRVGFIRVDRFDQILIQLRQSLK